MKDFVSGRDIDIQGLLEVLKCGEEAYSRGGLVMSAWIDSPSDQWDDLWCEENRTPRFLEEGFCDTAGCLVGNFKLKHPQDKLNWNFENISERFGLSEREMAFLFTQGHLTREDAVAACFLSGKEAILRLRKFLYYKMRKSELLEDLDSARRMGDVGFTDVSKKELEGVGA